MHHLKIFILLNFMFLASFNISAKDTEIDSLKSILNSNIHDTTLVQKSTELSWLYMYKDIDTAMQYAVDAIDLAIQGKHKLNIVNAYNVEGVCFIVKAEYYSALSSLKKGETIGVKLIDEKPNKKFYKRRLAAVYTNKGNVYNYIGQFQLAIENYLMGLKLFEEIGFENGIAICSSNIAIVFNDLGKHDKALEYNFRALEIAERIGDLFSLTQSLNNIGTVYFQMGKYDSAYIYVRRCISLSEKQQNELDIIDNYANLGAIFHKTQEYDSALICFSKAHSLSVSNNSLDGLVNIHYMIGQMYKDMGNIDSAAVHYIKSKEYAEQTGSIRFIMYSNEMLANIYEKQGQYKLAYNSFIEGTYMRDSIFSAESDERIADMEIKYKTEKKEEEIKLLKEKSALQKAQSNTYKIIFSSIIIILVLLIGLIAMSYRSYKMSQLAERRKNKRNAEKKVLEAVIETEYKERKRFAEDLHDSLGVLLSTLRLYINEIADENISEERQSLIKQSNNILDDAITNARNISNNIMPAALKNNGLENALRSFCDKINSSGNIQIEVESINFKKHHKNTVEITLYRILTEMINNTLKHAEASLVKISLSENNNKIFITYKDNGKGFDYQLMLNSPDKGMGLDNAISRINSIDGTCIVESEVGKGFFAEIEVVIN